MILADKIIQQRKKNGWSQEELAEKMNVSRQAVSKWESAQTVPDLQKILQLATLFGVTTDYLLKDEIEDAEYTPDEPSSANKVSLTMAQNYLGLRKSAARSIALATVLCILSVVPLILLGALSDLQIIDMSDTVAGVLGLCVMFIFVGIAVAIYIATGSKSAEYSFLAKGDFTVSADVKAQAQADIAEDGYWGVEATSSRIIDFATALTGGDPDKIEEMREAFKKGYAMAEETWGGELPDISKRTYDAVMKKFDELAGISTDAE